MDSFRQIATYPSRTVIAALEDMQCRHRDEGPAEDAGIETPGRTDYAIEAIARHGLLVGGSKACWRALRTSIPHSRHPEND